MFLYRNHTGINSSVLFISRKVVSQVLSDSIVNLLDKLDIRYFTVITR